MSATLYLSTFSSPPRPNPLDSYKTVPPTPPPRRVPSSSSIDDACATMLENLDPDLLVPLDLPEDYPFRPRLSEIKVEPFLRAMLKCAPLVGKPYLVQSVLATRGAPVKLQRLASIWFNRIIILARSLYYPARPSDQPEGGVLIDPVENARLDELRNKLRDRDAWHTTITRHTDADLAKMLARHGTTLSDEDSNPVTTTPIHVVPKIQDLRSEKDEAFSWELLGLLSGIDPRELLRENAHRTANALLGDKEEQMLFNLFAWYLEPELDFNATPIRDHFIFRRLLNVKGNVEQDKTPVQLRNFSRKAHAPTSASSPSPPASLSSRSRSRSTSATAPRVSQSEPPSAASHAPELPDPRYLALHAAVGGVLVKSGCIFYVIRMFEEFRQVRTLAPNGSSNLVHLFAAHSIGKVRSSLLSSLNRKFSSNPSSPCSYFLIFQLFTR
ncbi:hypothetical protein DL93DRAFT_2071867 [Clavulina sp. PMI_390]|nr:hypothetical protein DL93DRAFT_2071867 [Clavulina sp. PMI_390]